MLNPEEDEDQDEDEDEDESADPHPRSPEDDARDLEVNRTWFGYSTDE